MRASRRRLPDTGNSTTRCCTPARSWPGCRFENPEPSGASRRAIALFVVERIGLQHLDILKPVYAGDTIYPALEATELVPGRGTGTVTLRSTVFNPRKELVLEGMQKFLIRKRPV
jgi:acyl dehydratase